MHWHLDDEVTSHRDAAREAALRRHAGGHVQHVLLPFIRGRDVASSLQHLHVTSRARTAAVARGLKLDARSHGDVEDALPSRALTVLLWRALLHRLEPSQTVGELLEGALDEDIAAANLSLITRRRAALGRSGIFILAKPNV